MISIRRSEERGQADHGWLKSYHSFSFADYYDPRFIGWGSLRVINEDFIEGGSGFSAHPHKDMEIITYVLEGALEHKDSMGNTSKILPGEVQRMSAGTGVFHSEFNHLKSEPTHLLQIWIQPEEKGVAPSYEQKSFASDLEAKKLVLVVSKDGREGSLRMNQDADLYVSRLKQGDTLEFGVKAKRHIWVQVTKGELKAHDSVLKEGDALALVDEVALKLAASKDSEFILFDLV